MKLKVSDLAIVNQVKELIERDYKNHYSIEHLAQRFHVSATKLRQMFRQVHHRSIYQYRIKVRVQVAKELLEHSEYSIQAIAYMVGCSINSLEKTFKRSTGVKPIHYRKQLKDQNDNDGKMSFRQNK